MSNLGTQALAFAKQYVALVDALRGQGVPETIARSEARMAALVLICQDEEEGTCPLCGRTEQEE